jgi:uncharacterized protein (UPF0212 family)
MTITSATASRSNLEMLRKKQRKYIRKIAAIQAIIDVEDPEDAFNPKPGDQVDVNVGGVWQPARFESFEYAYVFGGHGKMRVNLKKDVAPAGSMATKCSRVEIGQLVDVLCPDKTRLTGVKVNSTIYGAGDDISGITYNVLHEWDTSYKTAIISDVYPLGWFNHGRPAI